jgi:hypothetical protein
MIRTLISCKALCAAIAAGVLAGFSIPCCSASTKLNAAVPSFESHQSSTSDRPSSSDRPFLVSSRFRAAGEDLSKSLVLTWGSVWTLKLLVDSDRPSGGDFAFPSGHTATAFAMAPVLMKHFGWKAGVPAYTLAAATALARLEERNHRTADVLVGAAIGLVIGSEVTSKGGLRAIREHVAIRGRGLGVQVRF